MTPPTRPTRPPRGRPGGASRSRRRPVDPARRAAYDVLRAVDEHDAYANLALPAMLADRGLTGRDAALATELAYGTLRGLGTYDEVLRACVDRPFERVDAPVRDVLRLGTHQVLAMRVPAHAAVSTTVDLATAAAGRGASGFVNAVMRRVASRDLSGWLAAVAPPRDEDPFGYLSVAYSHPRWVVEVFADTLGGDLVEVEQALDANNTPQRVTLVARPRRGTVAELVALGARPTRWSPWGAVLDSGNPATLEPVQAGRAGVQDEGSQLTALALAAADLDGPDVRWLDMCAGPGGKAALLAGLATVRGARLLAADLQPHRALLVASVVSGLADVVVADGTAPGWRSASCDRVLLDAPCSGLGALRRRPEARWRRGPDDVAGLARLQRALLHSALGSARPGGLVAYVTCSPHPAETGGVVESVLGERDDTERVDARPYLPGVQPLGPGPDVQLWPHRHGTDAMYLALLRRGTATATGG